MDEIIKIVAKYFVVIPILLALYVFIKLRTKRQRIEFVVLVMGGGILSLLLAKVGSHFISDPRPFVVGHFKPLLPHGNDNGFPSDHALLTSFLGFALLRYSKKLGLIALLSAALIGAARMAAGIHHLEDIVGSFVITGISVLIAIELFKLAAKQQDHTPENHKTES
jgi:undecaprenyl-diphosphatase